MRRQSLPVLLVVVAGQGQLGGVVAEDMQMISPEVASWCLHGAARTW